MKQQNNQIEWKEVELKDKNYFELIMGQSPSGDTYNKEKKGVPFFQGKAEFGKKYPSVEKWTTEPCKFAKPEDILMSVRAPVGAINISNIDCCIGRGLASIRCKNEIEKGFVYYFLKLKEEDIANLGTGSTFKAITSKQLANIKIALPFSKGKPDLKEQERIVKLLEKAEKQKERSKNAEDLLDEYLKSIFNKMFYNRGFEETNLGNISKISMGGTPLTSKPEYWQPSEINWMKSGDIKGDIILAVPQKISKEGFNHSNTSIYPKGTVVIALNGQGKTRGTSAVLGIETCSNQSVSGIIPNKEKLVSEYLHYNLKLRYNELRNITGDDSRSGLNLTILRNLRILLPPLPLQHKFTKIVEQIEKMKENIKKTKQSSVELFNSLMQKAFRGEL